MSKTTSHLLVSGYDLHYPKVHWPSWRCMIDLIRDRKPSVFLFGGDQMDNSEISRHTKGKPYYRPRAAYRRNEKGFLNGILDPLEKALPSDAEKVWVVGNHDDWEFQLVEEQPELEGLIDRIVSLKLKERGWHIVSIGNVYKHGKLAYLHAEWLTGIGNQGGTFPAKKLVENMGCSSVGGHTHAPQSFTRISPYNHTQKWMGWISPILGTTNAAFMKNRPNAWVNGFNVTEFRSDGNYNHFPIVVSNNQCSYGGEIYGG